MRRLCRVTICTLVLFFGLFELRSLVAYKGDMVKEQDYVQASAAVPVTSYAQKPVDRVQAPAQESKQKLLYLTFDDGPSENTEYVLDILKQEGITATFFVLGEQVLKQPAIANRIIEEGHAIGNHTFDHRYERLYASFGEFAEQVMKTDEAIYNTTGVRTTLVRAPGGTYSNFDQGYFDAMDAAGYQVHDWNVDSGDSKRKDVPATEILTTIKGSKLAQKLNVLLHDSDGHTESVKALPAIIKYYKSKGYTFASLTDQVKPIQFKVASKLKWSREQVVKQDAAKLALYAEKRGQSSELTVTEKKVPSLILHDGEKSLVLEQGEYGVREGSIEVSFQKLTDWLVERMEQSLDNSVVEAQASDQMTTAKDDEHSIVPLRATLQKFGIPITKFVYNDEQREIWLTK